MICSWKYEDDKAKRVKRGLKLCKNDNLMGSFNCGWCPYADKAEEISECTSKLSKEALEYILELELDLSELREHEKIRRFTPEEVKEILIDYGQHDRQFALGEIIKYDPSKIAEILSGCKLLKGSISECVAEIEDRKEPVVCKDCRYRCGNTRCALHDLYPEDDWFCADGLRLNVFDKESDI